MESLSRFFPKNHLQTLKPNLDSPPMADTNGGEIHEDNEEETTSNEETASSSERTTTEDADTSLSPPETAPSSTSLVVAERKGSNMETPPTDDVCPICFGNFNVPCRAPCGHWYCGGCILQYWNFSAALRPCKCPMCSQHITKLTPEASLYCQHETEVSQVLKNVNNYNRLFVGGVSGLLLKMLAIPLYFKRLFRDMLNPERPRLFELRMIALFLGILYSFSPFDFLRIGRWNVIDVFDYSAVALSFIFYLIGLVVQRRRLRNVRELAEIEAGL
ncbi:E3 ubiquitin-protein ligase RNF170-like isoform X2 [Olea europaea var. sylvestris]|uniref:E3 ubiquitin- ligase RNF170-like isoform X2 n=1 Tax=Olea europaea subsp. europaea TaxID=158383 RepID=A0A8S0TDI7_OLEEU|nr:E3 ubiquitin-protein ligase RNF170-like isoform X2 [Olea europaea var. sylvestris]CAA3002979.1 E3 ubiquitin- ligase RNF170-like isoform X2 [Olea europaea subsp. europaea]